MGSSLLARTVFRGAARGSAPLARARLLWAAAQTRDAVMCDLMLRRPGRVGCSPRPLREEESAQLRIPGREIRGLPLRLGTIDPSRLRICLGPTPELPDSYFANWVANP